MRIRSKFDESGYTGFCITLDKILLYNITVITMMKTKVFQNRKLYNHA